ncbi:hypothetical protein GCM10028820_05360 [Tessaracoccus terricola]
MRATQPGRHELGQNFLTDTATVNRITELVAAVPGPIVEWGTGDGAITLPLATLDRPLEGIDLDEHHIRRLRPRVGPRVSIRQGDILRHAPPVGSVVVSNVPFHLTTPVIRHLLGSPGWHHAILVTQWEVARKRAAVGGATQLTAQWWPWFRFRLDRRIPARAFRPVPSVDAGLLTIDRLQDPLLPPARRKDYQAWVARVFTSRGRGLREILVRNGVPGRVASGIAAEVAGRRRMPLPRDMGAADWVRAFTSRPSDARSSRTPTQRRSR